MSRFLSWTLLIKSIAGSIMAFATLYTLFWVGPALETRFMPAVSKLRILSLVTEDDGTSRIMAEYTKLRNCEYVGLAWFRGKPSGGFERVPVQLLRQDGDTSSPNRPKGTQRSGPWIIGMTPAELRRNSFARLQHNCWPFWTSTTDFWP